jgi:hypothetical protein
MYNKNSSGVVVVWESLQRIWEAIDRFGTSDNLFDAMGTSGSPI